MVVVEEVVYFVAQLVLEAQAVEVEEVVEVHQQVEQVEQLE
jgi:hypothetical protein